MNWYSRSLLKTAAPYSQNVCPWCSEQLLLDFWFEKGKQFETNNAIGHCSNCNKAIRTALYDQEEQPGFRLSHLEPISEGIFKAMQRNGAPVIQITQDESVVPMSYNEGDDIPPYQLEHDYDPDAVVQKF